MARRPFSLCVIAHNEEQNLPRCLASAAFADDIVVLDSGSTDRTVELARSRGARVFVEPFRGHVGQKNRAIELAAHPWVLALDADEEVTPALRASIEAALGDERATVAGYALARKTSYAGRFIRHGGWWPSGASASSTAPAPAGGARTRTTGSSPRARSAASTARCTTTPTATSAIIWKK